MEKTDWDELKRQLDEARKKTDEELMCMPLVLDEEDEAAEAEAFSKKMELYLAKENEEKMLLEAENEAWWQMYHSCTEEIEVDDDALVIENRKGENLVFSPIYSHPLKYKERHKKGNWSLLLEYDAGNYVWDAKICSGNEAILHAKGSLLDEICDLWYGRFSEKGRKWTGKKLPKKLFWQVANSYSNKYDRSFKAAMNDQENAERDAVERSMYTGVPYEFTPWMKKTEATNLPIKKKKKGGYLNGID